MVFPSALKNSWPAISMSMVRVWILRNPVPSVRIVQMRSTLCHGPSWQNMMRVGSDGENCTWFSQSVLWLKVLILPLLISMV